MAVNMERNVTLEKTKIGESNEPSKDKTKYRVQIVWFNVVLLSFLHLTVPYGLYLAFTSAKLYTNLFALALYPLSTIGMTAGVHRLWSHRAYKATMPLQIILMIFSTIGFQGSILAWARDHRIHHKYSETDADPHNAKRGFFFAHIGWLLCKKHPEVTNKGKGINVDDLRQNPIVAFQLKYYYYLVVIVWLIVPTIIPVYLWNETWLNAYCIAVVCRYIMSLHVIFFVNSAAHLFGQKPYNKNINPAENWIVAIFSFGEGWHNFHHTFPWDYKTGELGIHGYNLSTAFIDLFARIGWAYDLKIASPENVRQRAEKTGDGTHDVWGWGDKDQTRTERDGAILTHTRNKEEW